jgi:hypothetical protein
VQTRLGAFLDIVENYHAAQTSLAQSFTACRLAKGGTARLLVSKPNDVAAVFAKSSEHISPEIFGEVTPTVGKGLDAEHEGYNGIILIGPFNCLPFRISEAILKPLSLEQGMPLLTYETDACAVAPGALRQVEVHIQQVQEHFSRTHGLSREINGGLPGLLQSALSRFR